MILIVVGGEVPLRHGSSCNLGSINLSEFVVNPFTNNAFFNFDLFKETIFLLINELDKILDEGMERHPLDVNRQAIRDYREIGAGILGWADCLIKMGIRYGSQKSLELAKEIGNLYITTAICCSSLRAKEKGSFEKYNYEYLAKSPFYCKYITPNSEIDNHIQKYGLRNARLLSVAPTGSLMNLFNTSGGAEPIFDLAYTRKTESLHGQDRVYDIFASIVQDYADAKGMDITDVSQLPDYFVTAHTIPYTERIHMQSVWQQYIDSSISSTINLPSFTSKETVGKIFLQGWKEGLKGLTIYRDGCKKDGILKSSTYAPQEQGNVCPSCGEKTEHTGGCESCPACGWAACSI